MEFGWTREYTILYLDFYEDKFMYSNVLLVYKWFARTYVSNTDMAVYMRGCG